MDALQVADRLGIPHYVFDVEREFTRDVIDDFVTEYAAGRTPNPCVRCNGNTKFRDLLRRGRMLGCDFIATGHYARTGMDEAGNSLLLRGMDEKKDQSYFLWSLPPEMLPTLMFPLGELTKPEVREIARQMGLTTAEKPESMEICFVPDGDYARFLGKRLGSGHAALASGSLVTTSGEVVGEHDGYARFTVGQRKGLGGGRSLPLYVIGTRPETREVVVGTEEELMRGDVAIGELNWLAACPAPGAAVRVQMRHRAPAVPARVQSVDGGVIRLALDTPQRAVTPGQSAVLFGGDVVLGGGRIAA
jgi:tRNA-specific 2-thiouridylase